MDKEESKMVAVKVYSNVDAADEEAHFKVNRPCHHLDNNSTLLFILDNSELKTGNCC